MIFWAREESYNWQVQLNVTDHSTRINYTEKTQKVVQRYLAKNEIPAPPHKSHITMQTVRDLGFQLLEHPLCTRLEPVRLSYLVANEKGPKGRQSTCNEEVREPLLILIPTTGETLPKTEKNKNKHQHVIEKAAVNGAQRHSAQENDQRRCGLCPLQPTRKAICCFTHLSDRHHVDLQALALECRSKAGLLRYLKHKHQATVPPNGVVLIRTTPVSSTCGLVGRSVAGLRSHQRGASCRGASASSRRRLS